VRADPCTLSSAALAPATLPTASSPTATPPASALPASALPAAAAVAATATVSAAAAAATALPAAIVESAVAAYRPSHPLDPLPLQVRVIRLVTAESVEEQILKMQQKKAGLDASLLGDGSKAPRRRPRDSTADGDEEAPGGQRGPQSGEV